MRDDVALVNGRHLITPSKYIAFSASSRIAPSPLTIDSLAGASEGSTAIKTATSITDDNNKRCHDKMGGQSSIKKRRNSVVNTQRNEAIKKREQDNEDECYRAIIRIHENQNHLPPKERKSIAEIVRTSNITYNANVSKRTVQDRIRNGIAHDLPRRGRKSTIPEKILQPLSVAFLTCIQLQNAQMKVKANRPDIVNRLKKYLKHSPVIIRDYQGLYTRLRKINSDKLEVNTDQSRTEQRRLQFTTYRNIDQWFDGFKEFLIRKQFARQATQEEIRGGSGELIFYDGMLDRILNLDDLISDWNSTKLNRPFDENAIAWGQQEEGELHRLKTEMITIKDTELWKQKKKMAQDLTAALNLMSKDDMNNYIEGGVLEELKSKLNDS